MRLIFQAEGRTLTLDVAEGVLSLDGEPLAEIDSGGFTVGTLRFDSLAILPGDEVVEEEEEVAAPPKQRRRRGRKPVLPPPLDPEPEVSGEVDIYEREGEDEVVQ